MRRSIALAIVLLGLSAAGCVGPRSGDGYEDPYAASDIHADVCACDACIPRVVWEEDELAEPVLAELPPEPDIEPPPPATIIVGHSHFSGCGHYYWHNGWCDFPHPIGCRCTHSRVVVVAPPRVTVGFGVGFGGYYGPTYYRGGYYGGYRSYGWTGAGSRGCAPRSASAGRPSR